MSVMEREEQSEAGGPTGKMELGGEGAASLMHNSQVDGDGHGTLRQDIDDQYTKSRRRTESSQRVSTNDRGSEGQSRAQGAGVMTLEGSREAQLDTEGQEAATRRQYATDASDVLVTGDGLAIGVEKALDPNYLNGLSTFQQAGLNEALGPEGVSIDIHLGHDDQNGKALLMLGGQDKYQSQPNGPATAQALGLSLPLQNLQAIGKNGRQQHGEEVGAAGQDYEGEKGPGRQARTFDNQQFQEGREPQRQRAGSNTMLGDSVSTNNSPYYVQALANGPVLQGVPARAAARRTRVGSLGASTAAGSTTTKEEGQLSGGPRTVVTYPRPPSFEAKIGIQRPSLNCVGGPAAKAARTANYYGERARPRKLSNDLWNKVQMRRSKEKAAAGTGRVKSLNLETRGLLGLNKKDQQRFEAMERAKQQAESIRKPMFWNAQVQGNFRQYENLLGARGADLRLKGMQKRHGLLPEGRLGETQTMSSASHTFGNANSGAIAGLDKDAPQKTLRPALGPAAEGQGKTQVHPLKALENTAKQSSLHDSTENESPCPAVREPRSYPGVQVEGSRRPELIQGVRLKDQLRDARVTGQLTESSERQQEVPRPTLPPEKPAFVTVHDRLSQNKEKCALQCRFLQEERVPLAAASPELSRKARGSARPGKSRNADESIIQAENRYKRAPAGRLYHEHNTFSRTYLRDYLEASSPRERDAEFLNWATLEPGSFRQEASAREVFSHRPQLEQMSGGMAKSTTGRPSASPGQALRGDGHFSRGRRPVDSHDGYDSSGAPLKSVDKWRDVVHQCAQAADQATRRHVLNALDHSRDVSILRESYHRIYPLNLNKNVTAQAPLFKPIAGAREPVRKFLHNRHANAHMDPSPVASSVCPGRLSQGQAELLASATGDARSPTQATEGHNDLESDGPPGLLLAPQAAQTAEAYAEKRRSLRTVDALVRRPAYNLQQMGNEQGTDLQERSFQRPSPAGRLVAPEVQRMQAAAMGNKPRTGQEGARPRHKKYGSLDSNGPAVEQPPSSNFASHLGPLLDARPVSIEKAAATSQLSTLTSVVDTASKTGQLTSAHQRAKSQILQSQIYNKTMISNLNNITSQFLKDQIVEEIILNEYGKFLQEQPYAAQDEAKDFVLQPRVYDKVVESQRPIGDKWFPEQSDAIKVCQRGAIKRIMTHYNSKDPRAMIQEQLALNSRRKDFQQFKAEMQRRQAAESKSPGDAAARAKQEAAQQLQTLTVGPSGPSLAAAFGLPQSTYPGKSWAIRADHSVIPPVSPETRTVPDAVDTQTRCAYEKQPGEDKREYQPVLQRVSERAKVKLYIRGDLKKVQDPKQKYHRHMQRQIHDKAYQRTITLHDFVKPQPVNFGVTTTRLENEHIIPNQNLHLDFYPQRPPRDKLARAGQGLRAKSPGKSGSGVPAEAGAPRQTDGGVALHIEKIMDSYRAEQRKGKVTAKEFRGVRSTADKAREGLKVGEDLGGGERTPRLQSLLESLVVRSHEQAKSTAEKIAKQKKDVRDFNNLFYYQQYLAKNELGHDIFRTQQREFNELLEQFRHPDDWFREVLHVRKHQLLHPEKDLDGDGVADEDQEVLQVRGGVAGQLLNGVFYTREQLEEKIEQRRRDYFDLFELAERINRGLKGGLREHGTREKLAKLTSIDDLHQWMSEKDMLALIKPVPQRQPFE